MKPTDISFREYTVNANVALYHVFNEMYGPTAFNGSGKGWRRFDPLNVLGVVVPCYYAAFSDLVALNETVIRKDQQSSYTLTWQPETNDQIAKKDVISLGQVHISRTLTLIDLETVTLLDGTKPLTELLTAGEGAYPGLHVFSKWFHQQFPDINGLCWDSYQRGTAGERAMVLYGGDRVDETLMTCSNYEPLNTVGNLDRIRDAVRLLGVSVPSWLI